MKRLLSGIQPSGIVHIGNYLGAIKNWVALISHYQCFFMIADLHALTVKQDPKVLKENIYRTVAINIASGLNPQKCTIFVQSHIPEHAELAWILGCLTPVGELERMTQFKDKAKKHYANVNAGLFTYPVLQAADILIYNAQVVPVGADQLQHIELTRTLARKFNNQYKKFFVEPKAIIQEGSKIMSLSDPKRKMSKSDPEDSFIALSDSPAAIKKKIGRAVTDSGKEVKFAESKPAISNLLLIYQLFSGMEMKKIEKKFGNKGYAVFKQDLSKLLAKKLSPIRKKYEKLMQNKKYLDGILEKGKEASRKVTVPNMEKIREIIGIR